MTRKTRYFVLIAVAVLVVGLAGGLVAYLAYNRVAGVTARIPPEMRYVPSDVALVAFADVHAVMTSDLRRALMPGVDPESRKGRQMMNDFAGVDVEKQVNRVVAYIRAVFPAGPTVTGKTRNAPDTGAGSRHVRARADRSVHSGARGDHGRVPGRKILLRREDGHDIAVGLVGSDLIAMGQADLVRRVIDTSQDGSGSEKNIAANGEMMNLIRDSAGSTAWVVGQFDEISRRMRLPAR